VEFKPSFSTIQKECDVYFSILRTINVSVYKIALFFDLRRRRLNHNYIDSNIEVCCITYCWLRHTHLLWKSPQSFYRRCLQTYSNLKQFFSQLALVLCIVLYCLECNRVLEKFSHICKLFPCLEHALRLSEFTKKLKELYLTMYHSRTCDATAGCA
jgi:hypothetical protein